MMISSTTERHTRLTQAWRCTFSLVVALATPALAEDFLLPIKPLFPMTSAECDTLAEGWRKVRAVIRKRHQDCLDSNKKCTDGKGSCSCGLCQPYHNPEGLGQADIDACRAEVREAMKRAAEEAARQRAIADQPRPARQDTGKKAEPLPAIVEKKPEVSEQRQRFQTAEDASRALQEALAQRNAVREQVKQRLTEQLQGATDALSRRYAETEKKAQDLKDLVTSMLQERFGVRSSSAAGDVAADFEAGGDGVLDHPLVAAWLDKLKLHPAALVPFEIFKNAVVETERALARTMDAIEHFDTADPSSLDSVLSDFRRNVFSPEAVIKATLEVARSQAVEVVSKSVEDR